MFLFFSGYYFISHVYNQYKVNTFFQSIKQFSNIPNTNNKYQIYNIEEIIAISLKINLNCFNYQVGSMKNTKYLPTSEDVKGRVADT